MKLHMSLRKRIALCAALGLGAMYVARIKEQIGVSANRIARPPWLSSNARS
jgi:hypothetical protein